MDKVERFKEKLEDFENLERDVALFLTEAADYIDLNNKSLSTTKVMTYGVSAAGNATALAGGILLLTAFTGPASLACLITGAVVGAGAGLGSMANQSLRGKSKDKKLEMSNKVLEVHNKKLTELQQDYNGLTPAEKETINTAAMDRAKFIERIKESGSSFWGEVASPLVQLGTKVVTGTVGSVLEHCNTASNMKCSSNLLDSASKMNETAAAAKKAKEAGEAAYELAKLNKLGAQQEGAVFAKEGAKNLAKGGSRAAAGVAIGFSSLFLLIDLGQIVKTSYDLYKSNPTEAANLLRTAAKSYFHGAKNPDRKHDGRLTTYQTLTYCQHCKELLWGLIKQGLKCYTCGSNFHERCIHSAKACTNIKNVSVQSDVGVNDVANFADEVEREKKIGLVNLTKNHITFSRRTVRGDNSVNVGPTNKVKKDWAYKYMGMVSSSGNPNVMVRWEQKNENTGQFEKKEWKLDEGNTLIINPTRIIEVK